jgi:hypothetical protein
MVYSFHLSMQTLLFSMILITHMKIMIFVLIQIEKEMSCDTTFLMILEILSYLVKSLEM